MFEKLLFLVAKTLEIVSGLFWRREKLVLSNSERCFLAEKSDFLQVPKNRFLKSPRRSKWRQRCSSALQSVPFQIWIIRLFSWYSDFYQVRKIHFFRSQSTRNCVKVVLVPWKSVFFQFRKNRLLSWKSDYYMVSKNRFFRWPRRSKLRQGCSDALIRRPHSVSKNRLFSWKSCFFQVRKNRLLSWKSDFFQVRKNRVFRSPRR